MRKDIAAMAAKPLPQQTFRIGPRDFEGAICTTCGKPATYLLGRPYDLAPGGERAKPACAEHAAGFPLWVTPR